MHSESDIRKSIKILLEAYGSLNTTEVKQHLHEVLLFDEEDLQESDTRNEVKIIQRIGNVVSHQLDAVHRYEEGFLVDKGHSPALWVLTTGIPGKEQPIEAKKVQDLRGKLGRYSQHRYRKLDWDKINERNSVLGRAGEEFVYRQELDRVRQINPELLGRVQHLSALQGDGFGYDILSVDESGNSVFIEVKTTVSDDPLSPFYLSINERSFFEEHVDSNAFIYRVYDFDMESGRGKTAIIPAGKLLEDYELEPISFKVSRKD